MAPKKKVKQPEPSENTSEESSSSSVTPPPPKVNKKDKKTNKNNSYNEYIELLKEQNELLKKQNATNQMIIEMDKKTHHDEIIKISDAFTKSNNSNLMIHLLKDQDEEPSFGTLSYYMCCIFITLIFLFIILS